MWHPVAVVSHCVLCASQKRCFGHPLGVAFACQNWSDCRCVLVSQKKTLPSEAGVVILICTILHFTNKCICWTKQTRCVLRVSVWNCLFIIDVSETAICLSVCTAAVQEAARGVARTSKYFLKTWSSLSFVLSWTVKVIS